MEQTHMTEESLHALADIRDIRSMMERSTRFISLSGWSGVWAGCTALAGAALANWALHNTSYEGRTSVSALDFPNLIVDALTIRLAFIAAMTFLVAFCGAFYFTWRRAQVKGQKMWTRPAQQLMVQVAIPMIVGGVFCLAFLMNGLYAFIAPACLGFYGLALVNGSKYTLGEIRWLGYCQLLLSCIALFIPYHGIAFMAAGFGLLHVIYGIAMWNKYG
jgi:hypothetical protein